MCYLLQIVHAPGQWHQAAQRHALPPEVAELAEFRVGNSDGQGSLPGMRTPQVPAQQ
jgi:hypothetical protein